MPDNIIELIVVGLFGAGGVVAWLRARTDARRASTERIKTIKDSAEAAKVSTAKEWQALAESQRAAMEQYQDRLTVLTDRICALEKDLEKERNRSGLLSRRVRDLEQKQEEWRTERLELLAKIAELEGKA